MASGAQPGSLVPPRTNTTSRGVLPGLHNPDDPKVDICTYVDTYYDLTPAALGSIYITFGILYTFFGKLLYLIRSLLKNIDLKSRKNSTIRITSTTATRRKDFTYKVN